MRNIFVKTKHPASILTAVLPAAFLFVLMTAGRAQAGFTILVTPLEGGRDITFSPLDVRNIQQKEVQITINAAAGEQYQVYQRISEPLISQKGQTLNQGVLSGGAVPSSNSAGTLYLIEPERLSFGEQLVYTSSPAGHSDTFVLYYTVNPEALAGSGDFQGSIQYTVRPLGAGSRQDAYLTVFVSAEDQFAVTTEASSGRGLIDLNTADDPALTEAPFYKIAYSGNTSPNLNISQEFLDPLTHDSGLLLDPDVLQFKLADVMGGQTEFSRFEAFSPLRENIYRGRESEGSVTVLFSMNKDKLVKQPAGHYRGRVRYRIGSADDEIFRDLDVELTVSPVFELAIEFPEDGMAFPNLLPNSEPLVKELTVAVRTNQGKPYVVTQKILDPLVSESGQTMPAENFLMKEELEKETPGEIRHPEYAAVYQGDNAVYLSDVSGSPAAFRVYYQIKPFAGMKPGDYRTSITFSLSEK